VAIAAGQRGSRALPLLRDFLSLLAAVAGLWFLHVNGRVIPTSMLAVVWLVLTVIIAGGLFWRSRLRRRALLSVYVLPGSPLFRWLRGGWLMALRQLLLGALLALVLSVALVRTSTPWVWSALIASVPVLVLVRAGAERLLARHASPAYLPELGWRLAVAITGTLLLVVVIGLALYREYPYLADVSLERAVWHLVDRELARSAPFEVLLQMAAAKDGVRLWLAQQLLPGVGSMLLRLAGWIIVLAEEALFVWSYLLMCNGIVIGVNGIDRRL
jgi:hypothetical protein